MGPAVSFDRPHIQPCIRPHGSSVVRILRVDGHVELYFTPITAQEVMLRHPKHLVTRPEVFRSYIERTLIPPETMLMPGMSIYLVPYHSVTGKFVNRQVVLKRSGTSSTSPHPPVNEQSPGMSMSPSNGKRRRGGDGGADESPSRSVAGQGDGGQNRARKFASASKEVVTGDGQSAANCGEAPVHLERSSKRTISAEESARVSCGGSEGGTTPGRLKELGDGELLVGGEDEKNTKTEDDLSEHSKTQMDDEVSDEAETGPLLRKERCCRMTLGQILRNTTCPVAPRVSDKVAVNSVLKPAEASTSLLVAIPPSPIHRSDRNPSKLCSDKRIEKLDPILRNPKLDSLKPVEKKHVRETLGDHFSNPNPATLGSNTRNAAREKTNVGPAASSRSAASVASSSSSLHAVKAQKPPLSCCSPSRKSNPQCQPRAPLATLGFNSMKSDNPSIIEQCRLHKRANWPRCLLLPSLCRRASPSPSPPRPAAQTPSPDPCPDTMITVENPPALNLSNPSSRQLVSDQQPSSTSPAHHRQQLTSQRSSASSSGHRPRLQSGVFQPFSRSFSRSRRIRFLHIRSNQPLSPILEVSPEYSSDSPRNFSFI